MFLLGGTLLADKTFKKILSIGYEFETHDLAKLSLHQNKRFLINSTLNPRVLESKLQTKSIKEVDDNYFSVKIPIGTTASKPKEESAKEEPDQEITDEDKEFMDAFMEEYENEKEQEMLEKLEKYENDSYLEYFREYRKTDNKKSVRFEITNDMGNVDFNYMIEDECKSLTIPKNDMYMFLTRYGKEFEIKFSEELTKDCESFSGVEFIVTYYNPKKENPHIILDTFTDACSRIIDHFGNLKKTRGTLMLHDNTKKLYTPLGVIENSRGLYHKTGTNVFYMDTYDSYNTVKLKKLEDVDFIPQMTFRCKAEDTIEIFKELIKGTDQFKVGHSILEAQLEDYNVLILVESTVDELFKKYNETNEKKIDTSTTAAKNLRAYIFLIFYKLYNYIHNHEKITNKLIEKEETEEKEDSKKPNIDNDSYLKDYLSFASRHRNHDLYLRIKEILNKQFGITEITEVTALLYQPEVIKPMFVPAQEFEDEFEEEFEEEDGEGEDLTEEEKEEIQIKIAEKTALYLEKQEKKAEKKREKEVKLMDAATRDLEKTDKNYGNPVISFLSYFKYFEQPTNKKINDWLVASKLDSYSTTFDLKNDEVLTENRFFRYEISLLLRNTVSEKFSKDSITVGQMHKLVYELYKKKNNMVNLENNPAKKKLSKKCERGYYRNKDFKCQKQKTRKEKKIGYTKATLKQIVKRNRSRTEKVKQPKAATVEQMVPSKRSSRGSETIDDLEKKTASKSSNSTKGSISKSRPSRTAVPSSRNLFQRLFEAK